MCELLTEFSAGNGLWREGEREAMWGFVGEVWSGDGR